MSVAIEKTKINASQFGNEPLGGMEGWGCAEMDRVGRESQGKGRMCSEELTLPKERFSFVLAPRATSKSVYFHK